MTTTIHRGRFHAVFGAFSIAAMLLIGSRANASFVNVTTTQDTFVNDNDCSLREAIRSVQLNVDFNGCHPTNDPAVGEFDVFLQPAPTTAPYVLNTPLVIEGPSVRIRGAGFRSTVISGAGVVGPAFQIGGQTAGSAVLTNLQITGSKGSAILVQANSVSTISHVLVTHGGDTFTNAACLNNLGRTFFLDSQCSEILGRTPGVVFNGGQLDIISSSIVNNSGEASIITNQGGGLRITNSTLANNQSSFGVVLSSGGGVTQIEGSTIAFQQGMDPTGTALMAVSGTIELKSSIIAKNRQQGPEANCTGPKIISHGYNVFGDIDTSCDAFHHPTDVKGDPRLVTGPNNAPQALGGVGQVYTFDSFSKALNLVPADQCVTDDERGVTRRAQSTCDAGAVERTSALFVKDVTANTSGDLVIKQRLDALGFDSQTIDDGSVSTADATGRAVVVISNSVVSTNIGTKFKSVPQGVLAMEPALYDDMGWSLESGGLTAPTTDIFMAAEPTANIANNFGILTGPVHVTNSPQAQVYGFTDTGLADVSASAPPGWGIFSFPPLRRLPDGSQAAGQRVACFAGDAASADLTPDGVRLLDLAILGAAGPNNFADVPLFATFEPAALSQWRTSQGTLSSNTSQKTQGSASMSVNASGYTRLDSVAFSTLEWTVSGSELLLDVYVPPQGQPNPSYLGAVQMYLDIPSANVHNQYLGQVELTPQGTGWRSVSFRNQLLSMLGTAFNDASIGIAINTQPGAPAVLLDNLRFSGSF